MARIAIGGMQHETNTFAPAQADYAAFEAGGGWPGVQYGEPLFDAVAGANIPAEGAIQALRSMGHTLLPTAWAAASPSAQVSTEAFERIVGELLARLEAARPLDGVYLDLHGAMVTEAHDDGEGEILRRVRRAPARADAAHRLAPRECVAQFRFPDRHPVAMLDHRAVPRHLPTAGRVGATARRRAFVCA